MSDRKRDAEGCMVAICAHLSMSVVQDENFDMWVDCLGQILRDCDECSLALANMRSSAWMLVDKTSKGNLAWLKRDVREYYRLTAAKRFEALQGMNADDVVEAAS